MMRCPNCGTEIWPGAPMPAGEVKVGDQIKVTIEEAAGRVVAICTWPRGAIKIMTRRGDGQEFDHMLGTDHTVWLVKRG